MSYDARVRHEAKLAATDLSRPAMLHDSSARQETDENRDRPNKGGLKKKFKSMRNAFFKTKKAAATNKVEFHESNSLADDLEGEIKSVRKTLYETKKISDEQRQHDYFDGSTNEEIQRLQNELLELEMRKEALLSSEANSEQ